MSVRQVGATHPEGRREVEPKSSRRRLLELLQTSPSAMTVDEVAAATGLHVNTVRAHLQLMVDMGQLNRETEAR